MAIFVPIIFFFIALVIANSIGVTGEIKESKAYYEEMLNLPPTYKYITTHDPFDWEKTWYVWMGYFVFCCIFEYKLFADKNKKGD